MTLHEGCQFCQAGLVPNLMQHWRRKRIECSATFWHDHGRGPGSNHGKVPQICGFPTDL